MGVGFMYISTKGRYGLRAVFDLARHEQGMPLALTAIAAKQNLSEGYLEQLMIPLKKNGLVKSVRGVHGGYLLVRPAEQINVGEVLRALEGPMSITQCCSGDDNNCHCPKHDDDCLSRPLWLVIQKQVDAILDSYTINDLLMRDLTRGDER